MSTLNVDALVGNTSANAITVRGEGSATTSLQQGLAKVWCNWDNDATGIVDSLNIGSFTDVGSGASRLVYTTNMGNITYCITTSATHDAGTYAVNVLLDHDTPPTTSQIDFDLLHNTDSSRVDSEMNMLQVTGDLA